MLIKRGVETAGSLKILFGAAGFFGTIMASAHSSAHDLPVFSDSDSFGDAFSHRFFIRKDATHVKIECLNNQ